MSQKKIGDIFNMSQIVISLLMGFTVMCLGWIMYEIIVFEFTTFVEYDVKIDVEIDEIHPENIKVSHSLHVFHWKKSDIIRHKYFRDVTPKEIDSIKVIEDRISQRFKAIK